MMRRTAITAAVVLAGAAIWSFGQTPQTASEEAETVPRVRSEQLLPLEERTRMFRILEGDGEGERVALVLRQAEEDEEGDWVLIMSDLNAIHLRRTSDGDIEVVRLALPMENRAVTYEPAVHLIPASLVPQTRIATSGVARIYNLETGELLRTGTYDHELEQVSRSGFRTNAGKHEGYLIVIDHQVDLNHGQFRLNLEGGFVPGEGMVYRHIRYTIQKLAIFSNTTRRTAVLAEEQ